MYLLILLGLFLFFTSVWFYEFFYFRRLPERIGSLKRSVSGFRTIETVSLRDFGLRVSFQALKEGGGKKEFPLLEEEMDELDRHYHALGEPQRGLGQKMGDRTMEGSKS